MDSETNGLTHDEIWDDSAMVKSWNEALEEYKVRGRRRVLVDMGSARPAQDELSSPRHPYNYRSITASTPEAGGSKPGEEAAQPFTAPRADLRSPSPCSITVFADRRRSSRDAKTETDEGGEDTRASGLGDAAETITGVGGTGESLVWVI